MTFADLAMAAIVTLAPHEAGKPHMRGIAEGIGQVADSESETVALAVLAYHESGLRADVAECKTKGDGGRSVTAWQILGGGPELCQSYAAAARRALEIYRGNLRRCGSEAGAMSAYLSGRCHLEPSQAKKRTDTMRRLRGRLAKRPRAN